VAVSVEECLAHAQALEDQARETAEPTRRSTLIDLAQQWREQAAKTIRHTERSLRRIKKLKEQTARVLGMDGAST
jgi:hypothetical protein